MKVKIASAYLPLYSHIVQNLRTKSPNNDNFLLTECNATRMSFKNIEELRKK
jgi:hypothetical protein